MLSFQSIMAQTQGLTKVRKDALNTTTAIQNGSLSSLSKSQQAFRVASLERSDATAFRTADSLVARGTRGLTSAVATLKSNAAALTELRASLDAVRAGGNDVARVQNAVNSFQAAAYALSAEVASEGETPAEGNDSDSDGDIAEALADVAKTAAPTPGSAANPAGQTTRNVDFLGQNQGAGDHTLVAGYQRSTDGKISLSNLTISTSDLQLYGAGGLLSRNVDTGVSLIEMTAHDLVGTDGTNGHIDLTAAIAKIDAAIADLDNAAQKGVRLETRLKNQEQYLLDIAEIKDGLQSTIETRATEAAEKEIASLKERYEYVADAIDVALTVQRNVLHLFGSSFQDVKIERLGTPDLEKPADAVAEADENRPTGTTNVYTPAQAAPTPANATFTFGVDNPAADNALSGASSGGTVTVDAAGLNLRQDALTLWLVDADTDERVQRLSVGGDLDASLLSGGNYAIQAELADATLGVESIRLTVNGASQMENDLPFASFTDDTNGDFVGQALAAGPLTIRAEGFTETAGGGAKVIDATFTFNQGAASAPDAVSADQAAFDALIAELDAAQREMRSPMGLSAINADVDGTDTVQVTVAGQTLTYNFGNDVRDTPTQTVSANTGAVNGTAGSDAILVENGATVTTLNTGEGNDTVNAAQAGDAGTLTDGAADSTAAFGGHLNTANLGNGTNQLSVNGRVENATGGTGEDVIYARDAGNVALGSGNDVVVVSGEVDDINTSWGDDAVVVGTVTGTAQLGGGNDSFRATSGTADVSGGIGNDTLQLDAGGVALGEDGNDVFIYNFATATGAATDIDGGNDTDTLRVRADQGGVTKAQLDALVAELDAFEASHTLPTRLNGLNMDLSSIEQVEVVDLDGVVTTYRFDSPITSDGVVHGTAGADNMGVGFIDAQGDDITNGDDSIEAGAGNDTIDAGAGNDTINAGDGNDTITDGAGSNVISAGSGNDSVSASGQSTVHGGTGDDTISIAYNDGGTNAAYGEDGNDSIVGYNGTQALYGGAGNDTLHGGEEHTTFDTDTLDGGDGDDLITSGTDDVAANPSWQANGDLMLGGAGNDTLIGGTSDDTINGGDDADLVLVTQPFGNSFGNDTVDGGEGGVDNDTLDLSAITAPLTVTYTGDEAGSITNGTHTITFSNIETVVLGSNADAVDASADSVGVDIDAGAGNDTLNGGGGNDTLTGGTGRDTIVLTDGFGNDVVTDFDMTDSGDGTTIDQLDLSGLTAGGTPVTTADVTVTDTNGDGTGDAILTFAGGETVTLQGVLASQVNSVDELVSIGIPRASNGIVQGGAGAEAMADGYTDADGDAIGAADDIIAGNGGNDTIDGEAGNDLVVGGEGADVIDGNVGNDTLSGGAGNDTLNGGDGNDVVGTGAGSNVFTYNFEDGASGTATDSSINGLNASYKRDAAAGGTGWDGTGTAVALDGSGDYVKVADDGAFQLAEGTVSLRFKADEVSDTQALFSRDSNDFDGGGHLSAYVESDGSVRVRLQSDSASTYVQSAAGLVNAGEWTHVAVTFGAEGLTLYVNGEEADTDSYTGGITGNNEPWTLGASQNKSDDGVANKLRDHFAGEMDEFALFDSQLDAATVANLRTGGVEAVTGSGDGDDVLTGGAGVDTLTGGGGNDTMTGGTERDTFVLADGTGNDVITDFDMTDSGDGTTVDQLDVSGLTAGGNPVNTNNVTVTDTNGDGSGDAILTFAGGESVTLQGVLASQVDDAAELVAIGIPAGPTPDGIVQGTTGDDTMHWAYTDADGDSIGAGDDSVDAGAGNDSIQTNNGNDTINGGDGNDTIDGQNGNDSLEGGAGNDVFVASANNNTVSGGDDADHFGVGVGNDTVIGGEGGVDSDTLSAATANDAINITYTGNEAGTYTDADGDVGQFTEIEALELTTGNDTVNAAADGAGVDVDAGAGDDSLIGGAGGDRLSGDAGNDTIDGRDGADTVEGGAGDDTIIFDFGNRGTTDAVTFDGGAGTDTLRIVLNNGGITSQEAAELLQELNAADMAQTAPTRLDGLNADLTSIEQVEVVNQDGSTTLYTFDGSVTSGAVGGTAGNDTIDIGYTDGDGNEVTNGSNEIYAGAGNDSVTSGNGADSIYGGEGDDTLVAGKGHDTVMGGAGDDVIATGDGNDVLTGGAGNDRFLVSYDFDDDTIIGGEASEVAGDTIDATAMDRALDVIFTGNEAGTMEDTNDILEFSEIENVVLTDFNDTVDASVTTDGINLDAGAGNDSILGGAGNDTIAVGAGNDTVTGGAGRDTIVLADGAGSTQVTDFDMTDSGDGTTIDQLDVTGLTNGGNPVTTDDVTVTDTNGDGTGDAILTFAGGESVTLQGVLASQVDTAAELEAIGIAAAGATPVATTGPHTFNGSTSSAVIVAHDAAHELTDGTIELHFVADDTNGRQGLVFKDASGYDTGGHFGIYMDGDDIVARLQSGSTTYTITANNVVSAQEETTVALNFGAGGMELFVNGVSAGTNAYTGGIETNGEDIVLGAVAWSSGVGQNNNLESAFDGTIDSFSLYGTPQTAAEAASFATDNDAGSIVIDQDTGTFTLVDDGANVTVKDGANVARIDLQDGNNTIDATDAGNIDTITGAWGNDTITMGSGTIDTINTDNGNDTIVSAGTINNVNTGDDHDSVTAASVGNAVMGWGNDTLTVSGHATSVSGDNGHDVVSVGSAGTVDLGDDNDSLTVTNNITSAVGGWGNDTITVGGNAASVSGGNGDDVVSVDSAGTVDLGDDDDAFTATGNTDTLTAGWGNDTVTVGGHVDDLSLGNGHDVATVGSVNTADLGDDNDALTVTGNASGTISGGWGNDTITVGGSAGTVNGGNGADRITLGNGGTVNGGDDNDTLVGGAGADALNGDGGNDTFELAGNATASGGSGNDTFRFDPSISAGASTITIDGGDDNDTIDGTGLSNVVFTAGPTDDGSGNLSGQFTYLDDNGDTVTVNFSNVETLTNFPQLSPVNGSAGSDYMVVGHTDGDGDQIDNGNNYILAGADQDVVEAGGGNDTIFGEAGGDALSGEAGNDVIDGGDGDDVIVGGAGNDTVTGGAGRDTLYLGDGGGDDIVTDFDMTDSGDGTTVDQLHVGNLTSDGINPVTTADVIVGDTNNDGTGDAILKFTGGETVTLVGVSVSQVDTVEKLQAIGIPEGAPANAFDGTSGDDVLGIGDVDGDGDAITSGDDYIVSGDGQDMVFADDGNDTVLGGAGGDTLFGDAGDDSIKGGAGDDRVDGDGGNDILYGNEGNDTLNGGAGNDTLVAGDGADTLRGDDGDDTFIYKVVGRLGDGSTIDGGANGAGGDRLELNFSAASETGDEVLVEDQLIAWEAGSISSGTLTAIGLYVQNVEEVQITRQDGTTRTFNF
ncbi:MAG: LamG-like jellyroll fold domain-containing protein [Pseudomonadota bacterium]